MLIFQSRNLRIKDLPINGLMVKITKLMLNDKILESAVWEGLSSTEKEDNYVELPNLTSPPMMLCWKCNKVVPADSAFCPWCQTELFVTCPKCSIKYSSQYPACNKCGTHRKSFMEKRKVFQLELQILNGIIEEKINREQRIKEEERAKHEKTLPKILNFTCSSWKSTYGWGINVSWATLNVSLCQITIRRKGDNTYYPIDKSYDFSPNGEVMVDSSYFIDMLSVFRNSYTFILELTASNSDKSYVIHKEIEFKAYFPFYGAPTFYI